MSEPADTTRKNALYNIIIIGIFCGVIPEEQGGASQLEQVHALQRETAEWAFLLEKIPIERNRI